MCNEVQLEKFKGHIMKGKIDAWFNPVKFNQLSEFHHYQNQTIRYCMSLRMVQRNYI